MTRRVVDGFSMPEDVRIIRLPRCHRCKKVAPECKCGLNAARQKKEDE